MAIGVVGRKCGMTRVFTEDGNSIPVTVIEVTPNRVSQVKTAQTDGYDAVQVTVGARRASRVTAAQAGHFAKAGVEAGRTVREFRAEAGDLVPGASIMADLFQAGPLMWLRGTILGREVVPDVCSISAISFSSTASLLAAAFGAVVSNVRSKSPAA